jgi:hypothetical protein
MGAVTMCRTMTPRRCETAENAENSSQDHVRYNAERIRIPTVRVIVVETTSPSLRRFAEGLDDKAFDVELSNDGLDGLWPAANARTARSCSTSF